MNSIKDYWQSLNDRERLLLTVGAIGVILIVGYILLWEPWHKRLAELRMRVPEQQATLAWMATKAKEAEPLLQRKKSKVGGRSVPLLTVVERTATQHGLRSAINRIQPANKNQVKVWLSDAPFDSWLKWIESLKTQGIDLRAATINRAGPNVVSVRLTLQQSS